MEQIKKSTRLVGFETNIEFADAIKAKAKLERRTMASYMKKIISDAVGFKGDV